MGKLFRILFFIPALLLAPSPVWAGYYVLSPQADTYIKEAAPLETHGTELELFAKAKSADNLQSIFRFDLSSIPAGETIVSAIAVFNVFESDNEPVEVYRAIVDWTEAGANWDNLGDHYDPGTVWGAFVPAAAGPVVADVSKLVQAWKKGTHPNFGLTLVSKSNDHQSSYASRETGIPAERPTLRVITVSDPFMRVETGSYTGDGSVSQVITGLGFRPDLVLIKGENASPTVARAGTMFGDAAKELGTNNALISNAILSLDNDGFTVGAADFTNENGTAFYWVAFQAAPGEMVTGSYLGDGVDNRNITGFGFRPAYVMVWAETGEHAMQRFLPQTGDASNQFDKSDPKTNRIQALLLDGFQVGTDKTVNGTKVTYHYVAWNTVTDFIAVNSYNGNGNDSRDITAPGFQPDFVLLAPDENIFEPVHRPASLPGDAAFKFNADPPDTNLIQSFLADGFQVGDHDGVNAPSIGYYWAAFRDNAAADLEISLLVDNPVPVENDTINIFITLNNNGPDNATGIEITDLLPPGLSFISSSPSQGAYNDVNGIWSVGSLADGLAAGLSIAASVDPGTAGTTVTNVASIAASDMSDLNLENNTDSVEINVQGLDIDVRKTVDNTRPNENQPVAYDVTVTNNGPDDATNLEISDLLPAGVSYAGDSPTRGTYNSVTGRWVIGSLNSGETATLRINATVDAGTGGSVITNTAALFDVDPDDLEAANDTARVDITVQSADIALSKTVDIPNPDESDTVTFTVSAFNAGPDTATAVTVLDSLPPGLSYSSDSPTQGVYDPFSGVWDTGTIAPAGSAELVLYATVDTGTAGFTIVNTASVLSADQADPVAANNTASDSLTVKGADLVVLKTVDLFSPNEGDTITYTLTVTNNGPNNATGVQVSDSLPAGVTYVSDTPSQGSYNLSAGKWLVSGLAPGDTATMDLVGTVDASTGGSTITNMAAVLNLGTGDPVAANDTASVDITVQSADLIVSKTVDIPTPAENDAITYTLVISNIGPDDATGVEITDLLPPGLTYTGDTPSAGTYDNVSGVWNIGSIVDGGSATLTINATVDAGTRGFTINNSAAVTASDQADPTIDDDSDFAKITVQATGYRVATGMYSGTGSSSRSITGVGFQPDVVIVEGNDGSPAVIKTSSMTGNLSKELGNATPAVTNSVTSLDTDGFTVGPDGLKNFVSNEYYWIAFKSSPGDMIVGSYTGNGIDNRDITGLGMRPGYMIVAAESAVDAVQRFPSQSGDASITFGPADEGNDRIQDFLADGFQVGADAAVNTAGVTYHYVAWAEQSGTTGGNTYTGDGADDRDITGAGFSPDYVVLKRRWSTSGTAHRPESMTGDHTLLVSSGAQIIDGIQAFDPDGFQLGPHPAVNENLAPYYWMAFKDPLGKADLDLVLAAGDTLALEGDTLTLRVLLTNYGPDASNGVKVTLSIPNGLPLVSAAPNVGSYSETFGVWDVGTIGAGVQDTLTLVVTTAAGWAYSTVTPQAEITDKQQVDPFLGNNAYSTRIHIRPILIVDDSPGTLYPAEVYTDDTDLAVHVGLDNPVNVGLALDTTSTVSFTDGTNTYLARLVNPTYVPSYASGFALTFRPAPVPPAITPDSSYGLILDLNGIRDDLLPFDQVLSTTGTNEMFVGLPMVAATGLPTGNPLVGPGQRQVELLIMRLDNNYSSSRTLDSLYVTNLASGPGGPPELDSMTESLYLYDDADLSASLSAGDPLLAVSVFSAGRAGFAAGGLTLPPLGNRTLIVAADVDSILARDTDRLDAVIEMPSDIVFAEPTTVTPSITPLTPVNSYGYATVNGMLAHQLVFESTDVDTLVSGATDVHVATIILPANGYEVDSLSSIGLTDHSGGFAPADLAAMKLYRDNGDNVFDTGTDTLLGTMVYSGDRYQISGITSPADGVSKLFVAVDVAPDPVEGHLFRPGIPKDAINMFSDNDGPIDAAISAPATLYIQRLERIVVTSLPLADRSPLVGEADVPVLRLHFFNNTVKTVSLDSLRLKNSTAGPGSQFQRDDEIAGVTVYVDDGNGKVDTWDTMLSAGAVFSAGVTVALTPGLTVEAGLSANVLITCDVDSTCARDSDTLSVAVEDPNDVFMTPDYQLDAVFPLVTQHKVTVDGMLSFQITVYPSADSLVLTETTDVLVLDIEIPSNGYSPDVLRALEIHNQGTASDEHIQTLSLWADGGNGTYDKGTGDDALLGTLVSLGASQYRRSGLNFPLVQTCSTGNRFFVSCDLKPDFATSATLQFMVPVYGIEVGSGNDGPIDNKVVDPSAQFIPTPDKLSVFPYSVGDKRVYPGSSNTLNFGIGLYNGFQSSISLEALRLFFNDTSLKGEIDKLTAYADSDSNGLFDPLIDTPIATVTPSADVFDTLTTLSLELVPQRITYLFVAYDLSLTARDSISINMQLNAAGDLTLSPVLPLDNIIGEFAINSPGIDVSDGMIADQITVRPAPAYRAAPGENHILAMAITIPPNGFVSDQLNYLTILNSGTAVAGQDISNLNLWVEDGGEPNGFDPAYDRLVTVLTQSGNGWRNPAGISETIPVLPAAGRKCYITFSAAATANDGRTFRAVLPTGGVKVASGNDGPLDFAITNLNEQIISTDPLITIVETDRVSYSVGQEIVLRVRARNEGVDSLLGITAPPPDLTGAGSAVYLSGPVPLSFDLAPGVESILEWRYTAATAGQLNICAHAHNADSSAVSLPTCAPVVLIQNKPVDMDLTVADFTPIAVNRGQENVKAIRLSVSYANADSLSAPARFNGIEISVEDTGGLVAPNLKLSEITIVSSTGRNQPFSVADSVSNPLFLFLNEPVDIVPGGSVELDINLDIADTAPFSPFRLAIQASGSIVVADANDNEAVPIVTAATFPWQTRLVEVSVPAESLTVSAPAPASFHANNGQNGVELYELSFLNNGPPQSANEILKSLTLGVFDTTGTPVAPNEVIKNLTLTAGGVQLFFTTDIPQTGGRIVCDLATGLLLPPGNTRPVTVRADLKSFPSTDGFYLAIEDSWAISARDNNNGLPVAVSSGSGGFPILSPTLLFQAPASGLATTLASRVPTDIMPSSGGVPLFEIGFSHGDSVASSVVVDSLAMAFIDRSGNPLFPGDYFSQLCVVHAGDTLAALTTLNTVNHIVETKLNPPLTIDPLEFDSVTVFFGSKTVYPPAEFQVRIDRDNVVAHDANTGERITAITGNFPFFSDFAKLQLVGNEVSVALMSSAPPNITGSENGLDVFDFVVRNTSPPGYTSSSLRSLKVGLQDWKGTPLDPTGFVSRVRLLSAGGELAVASVDASGISFTLSADSVVTEPGTADTLTVTMDLRVTGEETFRFAITDTADVGVYDAVTGGSVAAATIGDTGYPLISALTHVLGSGGDQTFTNYPNPFAAGRDKTRVTFLLDTTSRVTLKLYTLWGAPVKTLIDGETREAGLHQDILWSGRNGDGDVVTNGVYYLVLEIEPSGGGTTIERRRKVGVVR